MAILKDTQVNGDLNVIGEAKLSTTKSNSGFIVQKGSNIDLSASTPQVNAHFIAAGVNPESGSDSNKYINLGIDTNEIQVFYSTAAIDATTNVYEDLSTANLFLNKSGGDVSVGRKTDNPEGAEPKYTYTSGRLVVNSKDASDISIQPIGHIKQLVDDSLFKIGGTGSTRLAAGDNAWALDPYISDPNDSENDGNNQEAVELFADNQVVVRTNCNRTHHEFVFDTGGGLTIPGNITAGSLTATGTIIAGPNSPSNVNTVYIQTKGRIQANNFNANSDARLKENFNPLNMDKSILDLPTYKFNFIGSSDTQIGCKAQDLQEICSEIVNEGDDGYLSIQESKIVYLLLEEVKKLRREVDELKMR